VLHNKNGEFWDGRYVLANAVVRARIDENIKEEAATVLATMGLTVSDAFRIMLTRIAREKRLPFELAVEKWSLLIIWMISWMT